MLKENVQAKRPQTFQKAICLKLREQAVEIVNNTIKLDEMKSI